MLVPRVGEATDVHSATRLSKDDVTPTERQNDFSAAIADYEANCTTYRSLGYQLVEVPRAPVEERADFIMQSLR